jgi:hypothetical protein
MSIPPGSRPEMVGPNGHDLRVASATASGEETARLVSFRDAADPDPMRRLAHG